MRLDGMVTSDISSLRKVAEIVEGFPPIEEGGGLSVLQDSVLALQEEGNREDGPAPPLEELEMLSGGLILLELDGDVLLHTLESSLWTSEGLVSSLWNIP